MMHAPWLTAMLENAFSEIYVVDCATRRFVDLSRSARENLQYDGPTLTAMRLPELAADPASDTYEALLGSLDAGSTHEVRLEVRHRRRDGTSYPLALRIKRIEDACMSPVYFVTGQDLTERHETARLLRVSEARFSAIVSNTPGLVYQFVLQADGGITFPYLNEGCHPLLGISAGRLQADATRFLALVVPEDRTSYSNAMSQSAIEKKTWNWVGRIWIEQWRDIKWINLRATPRALPDGSVQWEGIMTNVTQSKLEEAEVKRSRAQLAELSAHIDTVKEQERTRIAREIHDDLGGNLTAIKMALAILARRLPTASQLHEKAQYLDSLVDRTIESVHRIAGDLRPGILDLGLPAAIGWQAQEFEKQLGIACLFDSNRKVIALGADQATALFSIFQEALTNISKHAQASKVHVALVSSSRSVRLQIRDNGRGIIDADRLKSKSFGIRGMIERASALGGELEVHSGPEGGCVVSVEVPLGGGFRRKGATRRAARETDACPAPLAVGKNVTSGKRL
ncbi:MAG: hypothetical protein NVSMB6_25920 [Burkholderiaceae bacterium]